MRLDYPLGLLRRVAGVSRSRIYAWLSRAPSRRSQEGERPKVAIKAARVQNRETYGPLRMWPELMAQGFKTGRDRVVRLRRERLLLLFRQLNPKRLDEFPSYN